MTGQINLGTSFGNLLCNLAKQDDINTIVELGTWNGMGSTQCVVAGLKSTNVKKNFISIELYPEMFNEAKNNLANAGFLQYVELLSGRIIDYTDINVEDITKQLSGDGHFQLYFKRDIELLKTAPLILNKIPEKIDLLILDGGEYSTYHEFKTLKNRTKYFALDDTKIYKCNRVREELINDTNNYKLIDENFSERQGWSVFVSLAK